GQRTHVRRAAVGQALYGPREVLGIVATRRRGEGRRTKDVVRVFGGERRHWDDFEPRRAVAQQARGARDVAAGQHEPGPAGGQAVDQIVEHAAQAGEALERPQLEELVEQERRRLVGGGTTTAEERQRRVERGTGAGFTRRRGIGDGERGRDRDGVEKSLGRRR